jgi:hypothetical protein
MTLVNVESFDNTIIKDLGIVLGITFFILAGIALMLSFPFFFFFKLLF